MYSLMFFVIVIVEEHIFRLFLQCTTIITFKIVHACMHCTKIFRINCKSILVLSCQGLHIISMLQSHFNYFTCCYVVDNEGFVSNLSFY